MRIVEVELVGFKSFVDKTRVKFDDRITGVVGPNGCGKSNIVDAIRWVMGELSAKSLRGDTMEDVIFTGTDGRKPLSMAQVSLIFGTDDGIVPPGYEGFDQIEITRRLYRSGESEYLINKRAARLKDISEMLMDTGLGAKAYSIVEQGQIAKVLSSKPDERRALIEEAAGITKFKVRKEEALRKIDRTKSDLDRVQDVVSEIKRQMISLARQAGKAKRYKEFKGELKEIDLELAARDHARHAEGEQKVRADLTRMADQKSGLETKIEAAENNMAGSELELAEMQRDLDDIRRQLSEINGAVRDGENHRSLLQRDIENEQANVRNYEEEIVRAHERIALHDQIVGNEQEQAETFGRQAHAKQEQLDKLGDQLDRLRQVLAIKQADAQKVRSRQMELALAVNRIESQVQAWVERRSELTDRSDALGDEADQSRQRMVGLADRIEALRERHADVLTEHQDSKQTLGEKTARLGTLRESLNAQRERFEKSRESFQEVQVRLASLSEMKRNMEGYRDGVRRILLAAAKKNEAGGTIDGVVGVLAELVKVPERYEAAFEAVLGERMQSVIVKDQKAGMAAAGLLKDEGAGRGSFVPTAPRRYDFTSYPEPTLNATQGPLLDLVDYETDHEAVVKHLLDGVLVVKDLDSAISLHNANGYRGAFVTLDGEIVDPHGVITGGSREALSSGILQMKREVEQLIDGSEKLKAQHETARDIYLQSEGLIAAQDKAVRDLTRKVGELELELREVEGEVKRTENEHATLSERQESIGSARAKIGEQIAERDENVESESKQGAELREELDMVRQALTEGESGTQEIAQQIEALLSEVRDLSAETSADRERGVAAAKRAETAVTAIEQTRERIDRLTAQIEQSKGNCTGCVEGIAETEKKIEALVKQAEAKAGQEVAAREKLETLSSSVQEAEKGTKLMRKDVDGLAGQINQLNVAAVELKLTRENLHSKIQEKYAIDLAEVLEQYGESELDNEALTARQKELADKIAAMGEVNLAAIEEHDEAKERYDFYIDQQDDLLKSIDNLKQAISKINKESRERFAKTFTAVAAKFAEVIPMLFGGGSAQLSLTESSDVLDSGLDIQVRPPGKRLQNISLLSGGEKALSAIGLLFSIFLIKPSPFCLLDEVDAPLDDANVDRFAGLVDQMALHSQIILITHNKRTMERAGTLYGVTMQEKGVSKLVSVKMTGEYAEPEPRA
jgi:chromosome segregation protein